MGKLWDVRSTFSEIKTLRVEVQTLRAGSKIEKQYLGTAVYTLDRMERMHPCPNEYCTDGGFSIETLLLPLVLRKETHWEKEVVLCPGNEGKLAPGRYKPCGSHWKVIVDIEYQ